MTDEQIAKQLLKQYKKDDAGILLTPDVAAQFSALFREAVVDFFPKFVEKHKGQTVYGVSLLKIVVGRQGLNQTVLC